jgi:ubiquinone/menaquinone biosynthesis C-methylase UbiE
MSLRIIVSTRSLSSDKFVKGGIDVGADSDISRHYTRGDLLARLNAALLDDGIDPDHPTMESLAPLDQFHGRGLEATEEVAGMLPVAAADHLLDVGSGIGGPARYIADRFGCRVTGLDLTTEFCDVARHLTRLLGLEDRVAIEQGDALTMPFADASFDGAYSMNVSMNIADKARFYQEIYRVLRPGAWLVLSEVAQGPNGGLDYPTPWARTAESSFLATPAETWDGLEASGFTDLTSRDTANEALAFGARSRAMVERGEKPPHRAAQLIHGDLAAEAIANTSRGIADARIIPVEVFCRKPDGA